MGKYGAKNLDGVVRRVSERAGVDRSDVADRFDPVVLPSKTRKVVADLGPTIGNHVRCRRRSPIRSRQVNTFC